MRLTSARVAVLITCALVVLTRLGTSTSHAVIPGTGDPKVRTDHDRVKQTLEFHRRNVQEAYKEFGRRDAKWDAKALAFLEPACLRLANQSVERWYVIPGELPADDLFKLGQAAVDAGCEDAIVLAVLGSLLIDDERFEAGMPLLGQALEALAESRYHPVYRFDVAYRLSEHISEEAAPEDAKRYGSASPGAAVAAATKVAALPPGAFERRLVATSLLDILENPFTRGRESKLICEALLGHRECDPWITHVYSGRYHYQWWNARLSVGEDAREPRDEARRCLERAYELEPGFPEAAATLICLSDHVGAPAAGTARAWFDRAVTAQFDYRKAYVWMISMLRPRWGGSHEAIAGFARECRDTRRFDTRVPSMYIRCMNTIRRDTLEMAGQRPENDWTCYQQPSVFEDVSVILRGEAQAARDEGRRHALSELAGFAWQLARYDEGRGALDEVDGKWVASGFDTTDALPQRTVSGLYAMTGPHKLAVERAERAVTGGDMAAAAKAYERLAERLDPADRGAAWVRGRATELRWRQKFETGEWVDLMPKDADLSGWYSTAGTWDLHEGAIRCVAESRREAALLCGAEFGSRFEYIGTVEVLAAPEHVFPYGGPIWGRLSTTLYQAMWIVPKAKCVSRRTHDFIPALGQPYPSLIDGPNRFQVVVWDEQAFGVVNDGDQVRTLPVDNIPAMRPDARIGLGTAMKSPGATLRFRDLKIRKLAQPRG